MKRAFAAMTLVLAAGLSACGETAGAADSASGMAQCGESGEKELVQALAGTEDGYYTIVEYGSDAHYIVAYIDYATQRMTSLCARPECTHGDENCTACALLAGGHSASLAVAGDRLLVIHTSAGDDAPPRLVSAGLDGSDIRTICELPPEYSLDSRVYTDGRDLYATADTVEDQSPVTQLYRFSLENCEAQCLYTFPKNTSVFITATFEQNLCFRLLQGDPDTGAPQRVFMLYDVNTDTMGEPVLTQTADGEKGAAVYGSVLMELSTFDASRAQVCFTDLRTGETTLWDAAPLFEKTGMAYAQVNVFDLWDGWYRVTFENGEEFACYNVDPATGEAVPMTLFYPDSRNVVPVLDRRNGKVLVRAGWEQQWNGNTLEKLTPVYAVMNSDDYLCSNPEYSYIQGFEA